MQPTETPAPNSNDNGGLPTLAPATAPPMPATNDSPYPSEPESGDSSFHDRAAGRIARGEESQVNPDGQVPVPGTHVHPTEPPQPGVPLEPAGSTDQPNPLPPGAVMPGLDRPLTYGERAVGLTFNPSGREDVNNVKRLYAALIDKHHSMRATAGDPETKRLHAVAITELQGAQMWSVKALTWRV